MNRVENIKKYFEEHPFFSWGILFFLITSFIFSWTNDLFDFNEKLFLEKEFTTDLSNKDLLNKIFNLKINKENDFAINKETEEITKVEKIINFTLDDNNTRCVVVFGTYKIEKDSSIFECHFCTPKISLATFRKNSSDKWNLIKTEKYMFEHGGWGAIGEIKLEKIGKNRFGLIFEDGYTQQGEISSFYTIIDLEEVKAIFSEEISSNNEGALNRKSKNYYSYSFKIKNEKSDITNEFYPFCLNFEEKKGNVTEKRKCYEYNYGSRKYEIK
jgi:hypothetical protein